MELDNENQDLRRSSRTVKKSIRYTEEPVRKSQRTVRKRTQKHKDKSSSDTSEEESEENENSDELSEDTKDTKTSEILFEEQDVAGKKMFGFQTPSRRGGLAKKVTEVINSPAFSTPKTIKSVIPTKTPHAVRNKLKKEISYLIKEYGSDSDFSDSGSDYKPSDTSSSSIDVSGNDSNWDDTSDDSNNGKILKPQPSQILTTSKTTRNRKSVAYTMKTDEYFASHATSKVLTSNHTLQKLKNPKLSEDQLEELLKVANLNLSSMHEEKIKELFDSSCNEFNKWINVLNEGFSVLLYGLGSKRNILGQFQKELLAAKYPVIVVNGYFPSLLIKDVLDSIYINLLEHSDNPSNIYDTIDLIKEDFTRMPNLHLYLIVHNIEGSMLRNNKSQNILALLAAIPNIHLIASIDHINTPLIWDHSKLSKFNFIWWDATSFLPYTDETSFEGSLLVQKSGKLVLSSIASVYQSLTKNSKGVFKLIVLYQLQKKDEKHYQGMPFKVLYTQCRENFLVSSDLALRTQLTEFLDHKLVKSKRSSDGTELLNIPIHDSILQQFSEEVFNNL